MAEKLVPYTPDLEKIARQSEIHEPLILSQKEYEKLCRELKWTPGATLTKDCIFKAMERGVIRIWNTEVHLTGKPDYDVVKNTGSISTDFSLGPENWVYKKANIPGIILGEHEQVIKDKNLLDYSYRCPSEVLWFHTSGVTLALTQESLALSNIVKGDFDGRSKFARIGGSNHQTAGKFEPGWIGQLMMELSNSNEIPVGVRVLDGVASMSYQLLNIADTLPRNLDKRKQWTMGQASPFGTREPEWDVARKEAIRLCLASGQKRHAHNIPS